MLLSFPVVVFLVLAVLLAGAILVAVALPQMKGSGDGQDRETADRRHSSRTGR